ncbi:MAG: alpha/beta hydrolase [Gammaproteobacteria bacterium]
MELLAPRTADRYPQQLALARQLLMSAVDSLETSGAFTAAIADAPRAVVADCFDRPSLNTSHPTDSAIDALFEDLYASLEQVLNDPTPFEIGIAPDDRRAVRGAAIYPFWSVFENKADAAEHDHPFDLRVATEKARRRIEYSKNNLNGIFTGRKSKVSISPDLPAEVVPLITHPYAARVWIPHAPALSISDAADSVSSPPHELEIGDGRIRKVWYGTSRAPLKPMDERLGYGEELDVRLHYGCCHVLVPRNHEIGSVGTSWIRRLITLEADDSLKLENRLPYDVEEFRAKIEADLSLWDGARTGLVYIHGFRVTFDEAACLAAQIGSDLEVNGIISFFSWPAAGKFRAYGWDKETAELEASKRLFLEFFNTLLSINKLDRLDIVAHSMGNRVLAKSIGDLQKLCTGHNVTLGHLVLAAPDIFRVQFKEAAPSYLAAAQKRITVYTSNKDWALWGSKKANGYTRIGYEPPVFTHAGVDTVSVSLLPMDVLGHGYIATAKPVIEDLKRLLWKNESPMERRLQGVPDDGVADYWRIRN